MTHKTYAFPPAGLPGQAENPEGKAVFTPAYAVIPANTMRDIVTSQLPGWENTRAWILARPLSGFAETFAQYAVEIAPGGGSTRPEPDTQAQGVLLVAHGQLNLKIEGTTHALTAGSYAYLPPQCHWSLHNESDAPAGLHWIRKRYEPLPGIPAPAPFVTSDQEVAPSVMPDCNGVWSTTRFVNPADIAHDMHVNIVNFQPNGRIPFAETHVMEHGLYVLEGEADYLLNTDWVRVGPGDFMWLRAFCPQACITRGEGTFRYLLYKDVNRHPALTLGGQA